MSHEDKYWYLEGQSKPGLYRWIFENMALGAVYAALVLFGMILMIYLLVGFSNILPEDPFAALTPLETARTLIS